MDYTFKDLIISLAQSVKTAEELYAKARAFHIPLTKEEAERYMADLSNKKNSAGNW